MQSLAWALPLMRLRQGPLAGLLIAVAGLAVTIAVIVSLTYVWVWNAHAHAPPSAKADSESRLLLTAMVGSLATIVVSLLGAFFSAIDRSRALQSDRTKKAYELSTEAAFGMWKAAATAYRLLQQAETKSFSKKNNETISKAFDDAEKATLLFDPSAVHAFHLLWNEAEAIGGRLLLCEGEIPRAQDMFWRDEI